MEKINLKDLETLEHPWVKNIMENTRNGTEIVIELTPAYRQFVNDFVLLASICRFKSTADTINNKMILMES